MSYHIDYPDDLAVVRRALAERRPALVVGDVALDVLWSGFSNDWYCAGFMIAAERELADPIFDNFVEWLEGRG